MNSLKTSEQMPGNAPRLAIVIDSLAVLGGAERVLEVMLEVFPYAPIYTLVYLPELFTGTRIAQQEIHTSFIDRLPFAHRNYRRYLPLMPLAIEQFDLRAYDIILSSSYAVAHGVLVRPEQLHISFTHTPLRQAWHQHFAYLNDAGLQSGPRSWLARPILHYLRLWDYAAAGRVDHFLAASRWIQRAIWRAYRRQAQLMYPPVDTAAFHPIQPRQDYFIIVSRLELHKRVDIAVEAFSKLGYPLVVVGEGGQRPALERQAASNIRFLGRLPDEEMHRLVGQARAFILAGEEDFNIAAVEAQAAGCPVIAFGGGGACETIIEGQTGLYFDQQDSASLAEAVERFIRQAENFDPAVIQAHAARFSKERFKLELQQTIYSQWEQFQSLY